MYIKMNRGRKLCNLCLSEEAYKDARRDGFRCGNWKQKVDEKMEPLL